MLVTRRVAADVSMVRNALLVWQYYYRLLGDFVERQINQLPSVFLYGRLLYALRRVFHN
jgi:hypothetical protein